MTGQQWQTELTRLRQLIFGLQENAREGAKEVKLEKDELLRLQQQVETAFIACTAAMADTVQQLSFRRELLEIYMEKEKLEAGALAMFLDDLFRFYQTCLEHWLVSHVEDKVRFNLTVDEMLMLLRLMQEVDLIEIDQLGAAFNRISLYFSSQGQLDISAASLRRKYSATTDKSFERLEKPINGILRRLEQINAKGGAGF